MNVPVYGCFSHIIVSLDTIAFLDTPVCIINPYWQSNGIIISLCKYYIVISDTVMALGCVFLVASCNIFRASWETKKEQLSYRKRYIEEFKWVSSLFWLHGLLPRVAKKVVSSWERENWIENFVWRLLYAFAA